MIRIEVATFEALDYIARRLREQDRIELAATSLSNDPATFLADRVMAHSVLAFVARNDRAPVSAWGMVPLWPGVGSAFAFGTDDWGQVLWPMTKHIRRFIMRFLLDHGYHRIECRALATRQDVGRWVALFGAEQEAVLRSSGKRGEDFILYRWLSDEHRPAGQAGAPGH
jgi:hypothetical protein